MIDKISVCPAQNQSSTGDFYVVKLFRIDEVNSKIPGWLRIGDCISTQMCCDMIDADVEVEVIED
jgi:hypothetical protein